MESKNVIMSVIKYLDNYIRTHELVTMLEQHFETTMNTQASSLAKISEI